MMPATVESHALFPHTEKRNLLWTCCCRGLGRGTSSCAEPRCEVSLAAYLPWYSNSINVCNKLAERYLARRPASNTVLPTYLFHRSEADIEFLSDFYQLCEVRVRFFNDSCARHRFVESERYVLEGNIRQASPLCFLRRPFAKGRLVH